MKTFLYIRRQAGGCDYTIGCGVSVQTIKASSKEEAIKQIIDIPDSWKEDLLDRVADGEDIEDLMSDCLLDSSIYDVSLNNDLAIFENELIEVSGITNLRPIFTQKLYEFQSFKREILQKKSEEAELAQYNKLKKKFEKK